jgi:hypothetical protein
VAFFFFSVKNSPDIKGRGRGVQTQQSRLGEQASTLLTCMTGTSRACLGYQINTEGAIMRYPRGVPSHGRLGCCPDEWNGVPEITGSYELDGVIKKSRNRDLPARLQMYCPRVNNYGPLTGYDAYDGYSGDN